MSGILAKHVEAGLVRELRALAPGAKPRLGEFRRAIGCTTAELSAAIGRMRFKGMLHWSRLELSPSMFLSAEEPATEYPGASGTAREASSASSSGDATRIEDRAPSREAEPAAGADAPPAPLPDKPTGRQVVEALRRHSRESGIPMKTLLAPFTTHVYTWLAQMETAVVPKPKTVARVRAVIEGRELPPKAQRKPSPQQLVRRDEREALGLPPSGRELTEHRTLARQQELREKAERRQELSRLAAETRRPGQSVADRLLEMESEGPSESQGTSLQAQVDAEAAGAASRRAAARCTGTVNPPLPIREQLRRIAAEVDAELDSEAERERERALDELVDPSSLLRRCQRDWPHLSERVAGCAERMGLKLAEAWARVIGAGLLAVEEDLREEQA